MRRNYLLFISHIIVILSIASCSAFNKDNSDFICDGDYSFWQMKRFGRFQDDIYYYFDKKGQWFVYLRTFFDKEIEKNTAGVLNRDEKWSLHNDSLLILGSDTSVINFISDTLMVISSNTNIGIFHKVDRNTDMFMRLQKALTGK